MDNVDHCSTTSNQGQPPFHERKGGRSLAGWAKVGPNSASLAEFAQEVTRFAWMAQNWSQSCHLWSHWTRLWSSFA